MVDASQKGRGAFEETLSMVKPPSCDVDHRLCGGAIEVLAVPPP